MDEIEAAERELEAAEVALQDAKDRRTAAREHLRRLTGTAFIGAGVNVIGMIISAGEVKTCTNCGGQQGWHERDGVTWHAACGAVQ